MMAYYLSVASIQHISLKTMPLSKGLSDYLWLRAIFNLFSSSTNTFRRYNALIFPSFVQMVSLFRLLFLWYYVSPSDCNILFVSFVNSLSKGFTMFERFIQGHLFIKILRDALDLINLINNITLTITGKI